jgi:hypothetical protein
MMWVCLLFKRAMESPITTTSVLKLVPKSHDGMKKKCSWSNWEDSQPETCHIFGKKKKKEEEETCLTYVIFSMQRLEMKLLMFEDDFASIRALAGNQTAFNMQREGPWKTSIFRAYARSK